MFKLPKHIACTLEHNGPRVVYETVAQELEHHEDLYTWVSEEERLRAIETNEMWAFRWYPDTPVGFCLVAASSYEALAAYFEDRNEGAEKAR